MSNQKQNPELPHFLKTMTEQLNIQYDLIVRIFERVNILKRYEAPKNDKKIEDSKDARDFLNGFAGATNRIRLHNEHLGNILNQLEGLI